MTDENIKKSIILHELIEGFDPINDNNLKKIKKNYYKLAQQYHPDKNPPDEAEKNFQHLGSFYDQLKDLNENKLREKVESLKTEYPETINSGGVFKNPFQTKRSHAPTPAPYKKTEEKLIKPEDEKFFESFKNHYNKYKSAIPSSDQLNEKGLEKQFISFQKREYKKFKIKKTGVIETFEEVGSFDREVIEDYIFNEQKNNEQNPFKGYDLFLVDSYKNAVHDNKINKLHIDFEGIKSTLYSSFDSLNQEFLNANTQIKSSLDATLSSVVSYCDNPLNTLSYYKDNLGETLTSSLSSVENFASENWGKTLTNFKSLSLINFTLPELPPINFPWNNLQKQQETSDPDKKMRSREEKYKELKEDQGDKKRARTEGWEEATERAREARERVRLAAEKARLAAERAGRIKRVASVPPGKPPTKNAPTAQPQRTKSAPSPTAPNNSPEKPLDASGVTYFKVGANSPAAQHEQKRREMLEQDVDPLSTPPPKKPRGSR